MTRSVHHTTRAGVDTPVTLIHAFSVPMAKEERFLLPLEGQRPFHGRGAGVRPRPDDARGLAVAGDATDDAQVAAMVAAAAAELGDIDLLVANAAGDTAGMNAPGSVLDQADPIRARVDLQLAATLAACRHVVPGMRRRGGGSIVLIGASISRTSQVQAQPAEIGVAKAAQDALARRLAADLGRPPT